MPRQTLSLRSERRAPAESSICAKASRAAACMLVRRGCMFLLSLTAPCQGCQVSLKAGLYTYKALAERRGTASARPSLPLCPAPEPQRCYDFRCQGLGATFLRPHYRFFLVSLGRAGASQTRRLLTLLSVDWRPPSVPPSGTGLLRGTSVPVGLLTPPRVPPHRGCIAAERRCPLGEPLLAPAVIFRPEVAWPLAWPWPTSRRSLPGPGRRRPDWHGCL
jgi:hypothetical protein